MLSTPHGSDPPCLFGWVAALLCELRMEKAGAALCKKSPSQSEQSLQADKPISPCLAGGAGRCMACT